MTENPGSGIGQNQAVPEERAVPCKWSQFDRLELAGILQRKYGIRAGGGMDKIDMIVKLQSMECRK